jgi:hypothetical protein
MSKLLYALLALSYTTGALAEEAIGAKYAASIPEYYVSSDSEGFVTNKYKASAYGIYKNPDNYTGIQIQHNQFRQNNWDSSAQQYGLVTKAVDTRTGLGYNLNVGYNLQNGYKLLTTDSNYSLKLTNTTQAEFLLFRDRVETQNSLTNGIYYTMAGVSIEQKIIDRLSVVVFGGNLYFSDTNTRPTIKAKIIYDLVPDYGITGQIRYRQFRNTNTGVTNNYFNPNTYSESMLALGLRKRINNWMVNGVAGVGQQSVDSGPHTTTQLYELALTSPPVTANNMHIRAKAGYSESASFGGPNYSHRYFMGELISPF